MPYKYDGRLLEFDAQFIDTAGTQYPETWLRNSTAEQRAAVPGGITWEEPVWRYFDPNYRTKDGTNHDLAATKAKFIEADKVTANKLLEDTDWYVVRKSEKGTAIPSDIQTYRDNVRTQCTAREATINACTSVGNLESTMKNWLPPKADDGSANPDLLEEWPTKP